MQSFVTKDYSLQTLQNKIEPNTAGIILLEQEISSNLYLIKQFDYFFNGMIFSSLKRHQQNEDLLSIYFSSNFNTPFFFIHIQNLKELFENTRNILKQIEFSLQEKEILLVGDFKNYKEKLDLSFSKTRFSYLDKDL